MEKEDEMISKKEVLGMLIQMGLGRVQAFENRPNMAEDEKERLVIEAALISRLVKEIAMM